MRGGTWLVDPKEIELLEIPYLRDIDYQKERLQREGQIVPLEVDIINGKVMVGTGYYSGGPALVVAARSLEWETVLVTDDHREDS
jgi:hypothetical protein